MLSQATTAFAVRHHVSRTAKLARQFAQKVQLRNSRQIASKAPQYFDLEAKYGADNYTPLPIVLTKGKGVHLWDVDGRKYYDFLSAYSAVNLGHCPDSLIHVMTNQAKRLHLTSRAFMNDQLGPYEKYICGLLGYGAVLPMNTGVEGGETAVKLARKWGYRVKGVQPDKAVVLFAHGNFWGRTLAAISSSDDPESYADYGPLMTGYKKVPYNDVKALESALASDPNIVAFMVEPVQGEAGIIVPDPGYLTAVKAICKKHNVLFIADEVQTGLGRTGRLMCYEHDGPAARPDVLILGKALSGGLMPISAVLADRSLMDVFTPGTHGSTFGGNPLACAIATAALKETIDQRLPENAQARGTELRSTLQQLVTSYPKLLETSRGKGLLNALVVRPDAVDARGRPVTAWELCLALRDAVIKYGCHTGLLAKPTHGNIIRLAPPLIITQQQTQECSDIMRAVLGEVAAGKGLKP